MTDDGFEDEGPEADEPEPEVESDEETIDALRWLEYDHPRVVAHPDEWTTMNEKAGHTLVGPRCSARTKAGARCKAAASVVEGSPPRVVCGQHAEKTVRVRGPRGGSLKDRLRSRASNDYDALEDELLSLAQTATASKTFACHSCKRKNTVEIADAAVRLRAIEAIFDRTGAARATAASSAQDDLAGTANSTTLADIRAMSMDDLVRLRDFSADDEDIKASLAMQRDDTRVSREITLAQVEKLLRPLNAEMLLRSLGAPP